MTRYDDMMQKMTVEEMARIIEKEPNACERCAWKNKPCAYKVCVDGIKKWLMEEEEIKQAHWIKSNCYNVRGLIYECSNCNTVMFSAWNYCPHCGAKMIEPQESENKE